MGPTSLPRNIYINGRFLEQPLSGVQRYAREMLNAIDRQLASNAHSDAAWCILTTGNERDLPSLANVKIRPVRSKLKSHAWEQIALARAARDGALINLGASGPVHHGHQLVVIHDASVYRNPNFYSKAYGTVHRTLGRLLAKRSRIGTVSYFSRGELAEVLNLNPASVPVFYNGSDHMREITPSNTEFGKLNLNGKPYFVTLGSLTPNKNLAAAIEAIKHVPNAELVLIGSVNSRIFGEAGATEGNDRVHFAGRVDDAGVAGLLSNAAGLLFPSFYEGFGIPPLEAMVNGCPVIASDIPSVREVCGDAALYFDPHDPVALAGRMRELLSENEDAGARRRLNGKERAGTFTWDASARALIEFCDRELIGQAARQ